MKETYYSDGITKTTDPFWTIKCLDCGHAGWSVLKPRKCYSCNSANITCSNPTHKKQEKSLPS